MTQKQLEKRLRAMMGADLVMDSNWDLGIVEHVLGYSKTTRKELEKALAEQEKEREEKSFFQELIAWVKGS